MYKLIYVLLLIYVSGCSTPKPPEPEPEKIYESENFEFIEGHEMNLLNSWRQKNFDRHVINFIVVEDGYIVYWTKNPGDSRQVFVWEQAWSTRFQHIKNLEEFRKKYTNQEITCFAYVNRYVNNPGYILLLKDKLEPYKPSTK